MRFPASLALSTLAPLALAHAQDSASEKLVAADATPFDQQGVSCAVDGDTIVVGAYRKDGFTGAAYVYGRGAAGWEQVAKLVGHDSAGGDYFGVKVALSGELLAVGAHGDDDHGERSGAAYVYERTEAGWQRATILTAFDA